MTHTERVLVIENFNNAGRALVRTDAHPLATLAPRSRANARNLARYLNGPRGRYTGRAYLSRGQNARARLSPSRNRQKRSARRAPGPPYRPLSPAGVTRPRAREHARTRNVDLSFFIQPALRQEWSWMCLHGPQCAFEMSMFKCVLQFTL